jgi:hypothetical protein
LGERREKGEVDRGRKKERWEGRKEGGGREAAEGDHLHSNYIH